MRRQWIEPLGVSITQAAKRLGVSRKALSELWMNMQSSYDLWHAEQRRDELTVASLVAAGRCAGGAAGGRGQTPSQVARTSGD